MVSPEKGTIERAIGDINKSVASALSQFQMSMTEQLSNRLTLNEVQPNVNELHTALLRQLTSNSSKEKKEVHEETKGGSKQWSEEFESSLFVQKSIKQELLSSKSNVNLHKICITGGPCAGKTTALAMMQGDLQQLGFIVLTVPEAATILMKGGAMIVSSSFTKY
jgi:signal recognition particle GTPase